MWTASHRVSSSASRAISLPWCCIKSTQLVLTTLHSGGKYGQGGYKFSGGTHGVGAKCVNAVSEWFEVEVSRNGELYQMEFERGKNDPEAPRDRAVKAYWNLDHVQTGPGNFPRDDRIQVGHYFPTPA
jgi:hypothetical protein